MSTEEQPNVEDDGFKAQHLVDPPLVYVWIPVAIVGVILLVCFVRAWAKPAKNKGSKHVDKTMLTPFDDDVTVVPIPCPPDDDGPLPRRNLARLSHASECSDMSAHGMSQPGGPRGLHSQLQKLQLSEVVNLMLLPDSHQLSQWDNTLSSIDARTSTSITDDAEHNYAARLQEAYRPSLSHAAGADLSAGIDPGLRQAQSPDPGGTPHSADTGISGRDDHSRTPFSDELQLVYPAAMGTGAPDGEHSRRHKWLGGRSKQLPALGQPPESWSSPLQKARAQNHRRTLSHARTVSAGSDVLSHYATPVGTDADVHSSSLYLSENIESQQ